MEADCADTGSPQARPRRRLWRLATALCAAPALLVGGLLGYIWLREHSWTPPPIVEPSPLPDGYARRLAAAKLFDEEPYMTVAMRHKSWPDDPAQDPLLPLMRETLAKNRQALVALHAALDVPCWVPAPPVGADSPASTQGSALRRTGRVLAMAARVRQADRDHAGAVEALLDSLRLGLDLGRGRDTAARLNGEARVSVATQSMWSLLPLLDAAQTRSLAQRMERILDTAPTAAEEIRWQAPAVAAEWAAPRTWPQNNADAMVGFMRSLEEHESGHAAARLPLRQELGIRLRFGVDWAYGWVALVATPGPRERYRRWARYLGLLADELDKPYAQQRQPGRHPRPSEVRWHSRYRHPCSRATSRLLLASAALRAYRAEHGGYPERLDELVPAYLTRVPVDPFDLRPLRYRREGDRFRCWSVGPDGRDDGGRAISRDGHNVLITGSSVRPDDQGDIVSP